MPDNPININPQPIPANLPGNMDKLGGDEGSSNPTDTAEQNYTLVGMGNDHGQITLGQIDKEGEVTSAFCAESSDGRHQLSLDRTGTRKGWTCSTSPGNFQVECGSDKTEADDTLFLNAKHGNIVITACDGKIRLQGTDIELNAVGSGGSKGNIRLTASESVETQCKKYLVNAKIFYRIATPGIGELSANAVLKMYGSIIRGVTDAVAVKDSKVGGQLIQRMETIMGAVSLFR